MDIGTTDIGTTDIGTTDIWTTLHNPRSATVHALNYVFYSNYKRLSQQIEFRRREISQCGMRHANLALRLSIMGLRPFEELSTVVT